MERLFRCGINADLLLAALSPFELYYARDDGKEGVIRTFPHVFTREELGAALAHQNLTGVHGLTAVALYAQSLALAIPSVAA